MNICSLFYSANALQQNQEMEFVRNKERFTFLKVTMIIIVILTMSNKND